MASRVGAPVLVTVRQRLIILSAAGFEFSVSWYMGARGKEYWSCFTMGSKMWLTISAVLVLNSQCLT